MRSLLTILVVGLLACGMFANAGAQAKFGMGLELTNQPTMVMLDLNFDGEFVSADLSRDAGGLYLTPTVLFTIQATPAVFIEPFIGWHQTGYTEEYTSGKAEWKGHDLQLGVGLIYALKPDATVSPMIHPIFSYDMISATYEVPDGKAEISTSAFGLGLGIGGLVNLKETLYLTAEARLMYTSVGDFDVTIPGETDDVDTSMSMLDTDMAVGLRFVF